MATTGSPKTSPHSAKPRLEVRSEPSSRHAFETDGERALFIARVYELEEEVGPSRGNRQVADLVDDQERGAGMEADLLRQPALPLGLAQRFDQFGKARSIDAPAGLDGGDPKRRGQVALAGAGWAKEVDDLGPPDEVELGQRCDPLAVERGLEAELEALQRLHGQELCGAQGDIDPARLPRGVFLAEQQVDGVDRGDLALLQLLQDVVEGFQRARHLQPDQRAADTVQNVRHDRAPSAASRRPTAS